MGSMPRSVRMQRVFRPPDRTVAGRSRVCLTRRGESRSEQGHIFPNPDRESPFEVPDRICILPSSFRPESATQTAMDPNVLLSEVSFDDQGLVPAVAQDHESGQVLMLAYMNADTLRRTVETGVMTYWSRSRQEVWVKGQTSGNTQEVRAVHLDCDGDTLVFEVDQNGAACHTGYYSCFHRHLEDGALTVEGDRLFDPEEVYGD